MKYLFAIVFCVLCTMPHILCADLRIDEHARRCIDGENNFVIISDLLADISYQGSHFLLANNEHTLILPIDGRLSSFFGQRRDPFSGFKSFHEGIDIAKPAGGIVRAAGSGKVRAGGRMGGCGIGIVIEHGDGVSTRYCHLSTVLVRSGARVNAGDDIGKMGKSGHATGLHLHFEVRDHGIAVDPVERLYF